MFDSHVHLDYDPFYAELDSVAARMAEVGVSGAVNPAVDIPSSRRAAEISKRFDWVVPAVGIHPLYIDRYDSVPIEELEELASGGVCRAVGETGLDFWNGRSDEGRQRLFFSAQVGLAARYRLPLLIHVRKAFYDVAAILKSAHFERGGVFHAFSGSWEMAAKALDLGFHLSICANITRPAKAGLIEVVRKVPRDRLLVETDAPDMPPYPRRTGTHYPWELGATVAALAEALGSSVEEIGEVTERNALDLFGRL